MVIKVTFILMTHFLGFVVQWGLCKKMEIKWNTKISWNELKWVWIGMDNCSNIIAIIQLDDVYDNVGYMFGLLKSELLTKIWRGNNILKIEYHMW